MEANEQVYRRLQQHLDKQAVGYPASRSGADIRVLRHLFSPEEAELALALDYRPASVERIMEGAGGIGRPLEALTRRLESMALKGIIGMVQKDGTPHFHTTPLVVGMYEGQLKNLTPEFLQDFREYISDRAFGLAFLGTKVPQMRTIPVEKSLSVEQHVTTYDHLTEILTGSQGPFAIMECICRKSAAIQGRPCTKTSRQETCMAIGAMAQVVIRSDSGRAIDRDEALEIARMNQAEGLVVQPSNTQKVDFVCACCGCCCGMLAIQKKLPKPVEFWAANYHAAISAEDCTGCGTCVDRCQVEAVRLDDGFRVASIDLDRCIGCGNCIVTCPSGAVTLVKKDTEVVPPEDSEDLYETIMAHKKGRLGTIKLATKLVLKR